MTGRGPTRLDAYAAASAVLTLAALGVYLVVAGGRQQDGPAAWVVVLLALLAGLAAYAATMRRGHRAVLVLAGVLLGTVGLLAMLAVGAPLIVAAALCFTSALKQRRAAARAAAAPPADAAP